MWVSAVIGMSTKFFTATLAIMFRGKDSDGQIQGGPMYFIVEGLGKKWIPLAVLFSVAGLVGALPVFNVNQLTQAVNDILLKPAGLYLGFQTDIIIGIVLVIITGIVIFGRVKRISRSAARLLPSMAAHYFVLVYIILIVHSFVVPTYLELMFTDAFSANFFESVTFL